MLTTYKAVLRDNVVEWLRDIPRNLAPGKAVNVHITVLEETVEADESRGQRMAAALEKIAKSSKFSESDVAQWERDM